MARSITIGELASHFSHIAITPVQPKQYSSMEVGNSPISIIELRSGGQNPNVDNFINILINNYDLHDQDLDGIYKELMSNFGAKVIEYYKDGLDFIFIKESHLRNYIINSLIELDDEVLGCYQLDWLKDLWEQVTFKKPVIWQHFANGNTTMRGHIMRKCEGFISAMTDKIINDGLVGETIGWYDFKVFTSSGYVMARR